MAKRSLTDEELEVQIERAQAAAKAADEKEPRVSAVRFESASRRFILDLKNGTTFIFPADLVQGLTDAPEALLAKVEVTPSREGLMWEELDVYIGVPALMMGIFGTKAWMAQLGRTGGLKTSEAKTRAARENGKKGGRPKKTGDA